MRTAISPSRAAIRRCGGVRSCAGSILNTVRAVRLRYCDRVVSRRNPEERWRRGINDEIKFWRRWFETKGLQWPDEYNAGLTRKVACCASLSPAIYLRIASIFAFWMSARVQ